MSRENKSLSGPLKRGPSMDEFGCFSIRDFKPNDSVYFLDSDGEKHRAIVKFVDLDLNLLSLKTKDGDVEAVVADITFLDSQRRGWLD